MQSAYPKFYTVNDRPVKLVALADGSVDALVFDWVTGLFVPDRAYFEHVSDTARKDVDAHSEASFHALVRRLRAELSRSRIERVIAWENTGDGEFPYRVNLDGHRAVIRVNDFPAEPLYTLLIDDQEIEDLDDWPACWTKTVAPARA